MAEAVLDIKPWGNNLGARIDDTPPTLADRLARFDPAVHGGETMPTAPLGREAR